LAIPTFGKSAEKGKGGAPLNVTESFVTLMMPFAYHEAKKFKFYEALKREQYHFFTLDQLALQHQYYGDVTILHEELDQHFLPYVERRLFPKKESPDNFLRYSKAMDVSLNMSVHQRTYAFHVMSVDVVLCPFQLGFLTIRLKLDETVPVNEAIDFIHHMRILEPKLPDEKGMHIFNDRHTFDSVSDMIFKLLCPVLHDYVNHDAVRGGYFGSLPFFEDERMFASAYIDVDQEPTTHELYRLSQLDGLDRHGRDIVSAENDDYIKQYVESHIGDRFSPKITKLMTEHLYMSIARPQADTSIRQTAKSYFMSIEYYHLLLHYFYKVTLLKLAFQYSEISILHDQDYTAQLMEHIDQFSASYYFNEISSRSTGIELAERLKAIFKVDVQYDEVKNTLESLYRTQQNASEGRQNSLLFMLTIFTVVSGIYGMNLIIEDWKDGFQLSEMSKYSLFEWICFLTAIIGIAVSVVLIVTSGYRKGEMLIRKWKRKKYE
jgi:hypothetical protein